jgi:serine/threonine-protein kinase
MLPFAGKTASEDHTETCLAFPPSAIAAPIARYGAGSVLCEKYRLDALLGEGGMGAVWRASNLLLELPVAIKLIRADLDRNALRARLQVEARSVAKLGHPAIVRIYDVGETEQGDPFIVMELLQGETLAQMLTHGRLSAIRAVQLLLPIIDACAVAHARGIVHRDLKPDNLLIAQEDQRVQPKILDFGIAKLTDPRDAQHRLTEIGTVVGSPDYMSPEQARGRDDVDYRTDIWSLCVVLYEAITGAAPFSATNYNALLRAIVEDAPQPLVEHAAGDAGLWAILERGLSKDPAARQGSMLELGRALAEWLLRHGTNEDACGTSVDSKWLGRSSDAMGVAPIAPSPALAASRRSNPQVSRDSQTGVGSRGPFTATIRPKSATRARTLRVAAIAAGLLSVLLGAFAVAHTRRSVTAQAQANPTAEVRAAAPAIAVAVRTPTEPAVVAAPVPPPSSPVPVSAPSASAAALPRIGHSRATVITQVKRSAAPESPESPARAAPPVVKSSAHQLDLISPY